MSITQEIIHLVIYFIYQGILAITLLYLFIYKEAMRHSYKHVGIYRPVMIEKAISITIYMCLSLFFLIGLLIAIEIFGKSA